MTKAPRTRGPTQARCPDCNGSGQKRYYTDDENDDMGVGRPRPRLMACYLCRGAGRLTVFQTYLLVAGKALRKHRHNRVVSQFEFEIGIRCRDQADAASLSRQPRDGSHRLSSSRLRRKVR